MKLKIVNLPRFIRTNLIILGVTIGIGLCISSTSFSHGETTYKTIYVATGETLWSIAKDEKENNSFYESKNVRDIVDNIKEVNKLSNSNLSVNQKLVIPSI